MDYYDRKDVFPHFVDENLPKLGYVIHQTSGNSLFPPIDKRMTNMDLDHPPQLIR
jgi:hypothetical protein